MTDKFSLLAGIAADWWWEMDAELRFTFLSERFVEIFGLPPSSALGRLCTEVVPADDNDPAWRSHLDDLAHHRPYRDFEVTLTDASGAARPIKMSGTPRFAADGSLLSPARITVLHNGVLVQCNAALKGATVFRGLPVYKAHAAKLPLELQEHNNPTAFRNIWVRELTLP